MRILITAGGTREYIDPVRFISNASSGRMGYALARAAIARGHKVTLISAPVAIRPPKGAKVINVVSADDMYRQVRRHFTSCECLIMAAAVSDYTPAVFSSVKLKKKNAAMTLKLKPTADILKWAGYNRKKQIVVGFALEDGNVLENAKEKMASKHADMIIANVPSAIGADRSEIAVRTIYSDWIKLGKRSKSSSAKSIISLIESLRSHRAD